MFGNNCARESKGSETAFRRIWSSLPGLNNCLWFAQHLSGDAYDYIQSIRNDLNDMEEHLLAENPALAEKVRNAGASTNTPKGEKHK
jgi:hypothetical protein